MTRSDEAKRFDMAIEAILDRWVGGQINTDECLKSLNRECRDRHPRLEPETETEAA